MTTGAAGRSWGTARMVHIPSSEANGGDEAFAIFGLSSPFRGLPRGPAATAAWEGAQERARAEGTTDFDLDELVAAYRADGVEV